MLSELWKLNGFDVFKGVITAIYGALLTYFVGIFGALYQLILNNQPFQIDVDFKTVAVVGIFAGLSYLSTRFSSGKSGAFLAE